MLQQLKSVTGLARQDTHAFLIGHGLDERDAVDSVRMLQRRAAEVDHRGDLLGRLQGAGLKVQCSQRLQPRQNAADQQQGQQAEGAPEEIQAQWGTRRGAPLVLQRYGAGGIGWRVVESTHGQQS